MLGGVGMRFWGRARPSDHRPPSVRAVGRSAAIRAAGLVCVTAALLFASPAAHAATCPPIQDKPGAIPHVNYDGVQHLTYCYGPVYVKPGQNIIRLNSTNLFPSVPGYITRFDPDLVTPNGTVLRTDILHLHHAVWIVNGNPQFASGEEKTILQLPRGFGWRSRPTDSWYVNDMLHGLVGHLHLPRPGRRRAAQPDRLQADLDARPPCDPGQHGRPPAPARPEDNP